MPSRLPQEIFSDFRLPLDRVEIISIYRLGTTSLTVEIPTRRPRAK